MDRLEDATETDAKNITDIDGENTDKVAEVDKDSGDDNARESTFNTVIIDTDTGDLRVNNNQEEDDEDDVGDISEVGPDDVDWRSGFSRNRVNSDKVFKDFIGAIDDICEETGARTD